MVRGLPCCVLKRMKARELLGDMEALKTVSKRMRKDQLKALLQGVSAARGGRSILRRNRTHCCSSRMSGKLRCANSLTDDSFPRSWART